MLSEATYSLPPDLSLFGKSPCPYKGGEGAHEMRLLQMQRERRWIPD